MAIKNSKIGGTDWSKEAFNHVDVNDTFDGTINRLPPIGAIIAWLKSYTNTPSLPDGWVECDGSTLSDSDSLYNGQVIPDLNGDNRFLRGNATSGTTGGSETKDVSHTHNVTLPGDAGGAVGGLEPVPAGSYTTGSGGSSTQDIMPPYYDVVWIMRVK